jgi:acyl-CoA synthetase (AMP-forming)/AMP-acid ligase II
LSTCLVLEDGSGADCQDKMYEDALKGQSELRQFPEPWCDRSADYIFVIYTGGTTGMPKGVMWRHEDFYHNVVCMNTATENPEDILQYGKQDEPMRSMVLSPLMHGGGQFFLILTILRGGVMAIPVSRSLDTEEILSTIEREKIAYLSIIGDAMAQPIARAKMEGDYDTSSLAVVSSGGAILTQGGRELIREAFGDSIYMTGGIGGSEIGSAAVEASKGGFTSGPRFNPNAMMAVLDENLDPLEPGSEKVGFLAMKGFIPLGYYNAPEKTAEVFRHDKQGTRWVLAGDRAKLEEDGTMTLVGRDSQCINSGGEKIFVEEVERAISSHPGVHYCLVTGVPDPVWQQRVVALVELASEVSSLELEELQDHCRQFIAGYKVPRELLVTAIKRSPNGKPNYGWARQYAEQQIAKREQVA